MARTYAVIFFILSVYAIPAQNRDFDSIYKYTATELIYTQPTEAIKNMDLLYSIAPDNISRVRSLLLKAEIFRMAGLRNEAVHTLLKADSLTEPGNFRQLLLINGLLATNYRENKLPVASRRHLEKAREIIRNIEDTEEKNKLLSNIYQEMAYVKSDEKKYCEAIGLIRKSNEMLSYLDSTKTNISFSLSLNNQTIGENFVNMGQPDSAIIYFNKSLSFLDKSQSPESTLKGFILFGLAKAALAKKNYKEAEDLFDQAEHIGVKGQNNSLLKDIYSSLTAYYRETDENSKYITTNEKYLKLLDEEESLQKSISESLIPYLGLPQENVPEPPKPSQWWVFFLGGTLILSVALVIIRKSKEAEHPLVPDREDLAPKIEKYSPEVNKEYMSDEAMAAIVEKLKEMETREFFLDKNLSLASVAAEVGVNHRYLSYTVNQKLGKDFTTYINDLRVDYIIEFLQEDKRHLNYKISYLADIGGFSSHNRFSIIFKKSKGISPSELIHELQDQQAIEKE